MVQLKCGHLHKRQCGVKVFCLKETTRWNADQALNRGGGGGRGGILNIVLGNLGNIE